MINQAAVREGDLGGRTAAVVDVMPAICAPKSAYDNPVPLACFLI